MPGRDADVGTVGRDEVRLPGADRAGAAPVMDDRVHRELQELPVPALRRRRALLVTEVRRVEHWSRLLRARRDLLVATAVDPGDLTVPVEAGVAGGPLEQLLGVRDLCVDPTSGGVSSAATAEGAPPVLDPGHDLRGLLLLDRPRTTATPTPPPAGPAGPAAVTFPDQLHDLAAAQRRLEDYRTALSAELALATEVFLERCAILFGDASASPAGDPGAA